MKKRIFSALLALCMILALLPEPALAVPTLATAVTVGGVTLNTGNPYATTNASGMVTTADATEANYNVKFDAATATLTLRNANINHSASGSAIYAAGDLVIVAEGTNMVSASSTFYTAIQVDTLTLKGIGALTTVSDTSAAVFAGSDITVTEGITLTAVGGTLAGQFGGSGLYAFYDIEIMGSATVTAVGGACSTPGIAGFSGSAGIKAGTSVTIGERATVTAVGGDTTAGGYSAGIAAGFDPSTGAITVADNAKVVAVGGNGGTNASYGLYAYGASGSITHTGGLLVAKGGKGATSFAMNQLLEGDTMVGVAVTTEASSATNESKYCVVSPKTGAAAVFHVVTESVSKDTPNETADHIEWGTNGLTLNNTVVIAPDVSEDVSTALNMQGMPAGATLTLEGFNVLLAGASLGFSAAVDGGGSHADLTITGDGDLTAISVNGGQCYGIVNAKELSSTGAITAIGGGTGSNYGIRYGGTPFSISAGAGKVIAIAAGSGSSNSYGIEKGSLGGALSISGGSGVAVGRNSALNAAPNTTGLAAMGAYTDTAMAWGPLPPAAVSATPAASATAVAKTSATQASVDFTLTTYPAGTYKVYADGSTATIHGTVTASLSGNALTLAHATDIPAGDYYITVTEPGKTESARLALTVDAYVPPAPPPPPSGGTTPAPGTPVIVDGKTVNIGAEKKSGDTTTVTIDQAKLSESLAGAVSGSSVVVPVSGSTTATASLVVRNIEDMAAKDMTLTVRTGNVAYNLHASAIVTAALAAAFPGADMGYVPFDVSIQNSSVSVQGETLVLAPVAFTVTASYNGQTVSVDTFSAYIDRVIEVTAAQAARIATAVVVNADGSTRHVPTKIIEKDGKYYAVINSRTNSVYALIENEVSFADAAEKWYEAAVNEMGSRKIISGRSASVFDGEAGITRAEFSAILVRALGLRADGTSSFSDVSASAWYTGAIATATQHGLVAGKGENRFEPDAQITRQEAMLMLKRAAALTTFTGSSGGLDSFADANSVGTWAIDAARWSVGSGLIQGAGGKLNPTSNITRAESATVILRLLQKANLVDVRSKV